MNDESTMKRLAFIKHLYGVALEQSRQPEPLGASSVLTFHDSVELFLQLAVEHYGAGSSQNFMEYWESLKPKLPEGGLSQKEPMRRLNKSRVNLKHHGIIPSKMDIESFRASVTNFFEDNSPMVFGVSFDAVYMANFVACAEAKSSLENARY